MYYLQYKVVPQKFITNLEDTLFQTSCKGSWYHGSIACSLYVFLKLSVDTNGPRNSHSPGFKIDILRLLVHETQFCYAIHRSLADSN